MSASDTMTQECWRRRRDGKLFTVVYERRGRTQLKPAEAKNLKNTRWLDTHRLPELYEPADAPPPPTLAERVEAEIGIPSGAGADVQVTIGFPLSLGPEGWACEAVNFVRRYADPSWKWMNVPENEKKKGEGWFALDVYAREGGVKLHLDGPGGWTQKQAQALQESLKAAKDGKKPPPVEPDHRCPRCAFGWSDDD
jgi:hypothetical protein